MALSACAALTLSLAATWWHNRRAWTAPGDKRPLRHSLRRQQGLALAASALGWLGAGLLWAAAGPGLALFALALKWLFATVSLTTLLAWTIHRHVRQVDLRLPGEGGYWWGYGAALAWAWYFTGFPGSIYPRPPTGRHLAALVWGWLPRK